MAIGKKSVHDVFQRMQTPFSFHSESVVDIQGIALEM